MEKPGLTVCYCTHNRDYYTGITLPRLIDECRNSKYFKALYILDDASEDTTDSIIKSIDFDFVYLVEDHKNSTWQPNRMRTLCETDLMYKVDNDILLPEGALDFMYNRMQERPDFLSLMMQEGTDLPYIGNWHIETHSFTSGLGIHRIKLFPEIGSYKRYFGFQEAQRQAMKTYTMKVGRVHDVYNTNLDGSCWSKAKEYKRKGLQRILVGTEKSVYL